VKYKQLFLLAALFLFFQFHPFLFGKTLFFGDNYSLMIPGKLFTVEWLESGVLPLWNPTIFSGIPWIGDINQSILYPTTAFFFLFSPAIALNITIVIHLFLAFFGMVLLVRRWQSDLPSMVVGGVLWMFSTHLMGSIHNLSIIQSLPWFPWIIWAGLEIGSRKRAILVFSFLVMLQLAGGYPQHVLLSIGTAVLFSAICFLRKGNYWQWLQQWLLAAAIVVGVSSVFWLPFVDVFVRSTRMLQTVEQAQVGSLHPVMLAKVFLVTMFDNPVAGFKWGPAWSGEQNVVFYVSWLGIIILGFVLTGFRRLPKLDMFLLLLSGVTIVLSLGLYLPFYAALQRMLPLLRIGRYPSMLLIITNISLILLIARNFSKITFSKKFFWLVFTTFVLLFMVVISLLLVVWLEPNGLWQWMNGLSGGRLVGSAFHTFERDTIILRTLLSQLLAVTVISCAGLVYFYKRRLFLAAICIGLDIVISTHGMFIFADNSVYSSRQQLRSSLTPTYVDNQGRARFLTRNSNMPYADFGSYWEALVVREPFSDSYVTQQELTEQAILQQLRDGLTPNWNMVVGVPVVHGYTTLLPQDYAAIWQVSDLPRINFIDTIESSNELLAQWAVGQYVVDTWFPLYGEQLPDEKFASIDNLDFYVIPGALDRFRYENDLPAKLSLRAETPNELVLTVVASDASHLIIADRYDKDWRATVNDSEVSIENYNGMRRIPLEQGQNRIRMWYEPKLFYFGLGISMLTAAFCTAYFFIVRKKLSSH